MELFLAQVFFHFHRKNNTVKILFYLLNFPVPLRVDLNTNKPPPSVLFRDPFLKNKIQTFLFFFLQVAHVSFALIFNDFFF